MIKNWKIVEHQTANGHTAPSYTVFIEGTEADTVTLAGKLLMYNPSCEESAVESYNYSILLSPQVDNVLDDIKKTIQDFVSPAEKIEIPKSPAPTIEEPPTVTDKDMLIKDMEGTVLDNMPLEDIFSAETKYDMFLDLKNNTLTKNSPEQRADKISAATEKKDSLESSFNVFEQDMKEQTCIIDLDKLDSPSNNDNLTPNEIDNAFSAQKISVGETPLPVEPSSLVPEISIHSDENAIENTLRSSVESLAKTFNLETSIDAKALRTQYEAALSKQATSKENNPATRSNFVDTMQDTTEPKLMPTLQKPKAPVLPKIQPIKPKEDSIMDNKNFIDTNSANHTQKPSMSKPPAAPIQKTPAQSRQPINPTTVEKKKDIDHSIELPLSEIKKYNWPLEVPLVPTYTLENMVLSVNRFAHATAVSVLGNPGKLYNPLVFYGVTGTGKTHFLNAMAYAFSKKFSQEEIFLTNGVRLSRGIQRYIADGNIEKFNKFMDTVKVMLIDDIHLLAINEQNKRQVSSLLNKFLQEKKQIIITSKYPPESLERLENLIQFKLRSGWISELKHVSGTAYTKQATKVLQENGIILTETQIADFFDKSKMTLGSLTRAVHRVKVLENLVFPHLEQKDRSQVKLLEKLIPINGEDSSSEILQKQMTEITSVPVIGNGEWGKIGFFYPQTHAETMNWMVYAIQQRAKELGIPGGFEIAVRSSYTTTNIISSAFKIANLCDNRKLKGAIILGPLTTEVDPSVRVNFYDILTHMLEVMLIRCGIINYEDLRKPSTYTKILTEILR